MKGIGGERGAGLWATDDKEDWDGVFNHMCLDLHMSLHIAECLQQCIQHRDGRRRIFATGKEQYLREIRDPHFLQLVANAAWIHDIGKRCDEEDRARTIVEGGESPVDRHHFAGFQIAKRIGRMSTDIARSARAAITHHFYRGKKAGFTLGLIDKIVILSDELSGQSYVPLQQRFADLRKRWITDSPRPLVNPERFDAHEATTYEIESEILGILGTTEEDFLASVPPEREEVRLLRNARVRGMEDEATHIVRRIQEGRQVCRESILELL